MIRLLIADDHAIVREGLKQLFALCDDFVVAGEAANGGQVLDAIHGGDLDMVLLDMTMSGVSGIDLISRIRAHHPRLPVLVLSMHNEPQIAKRALKAGASGYLTKDSDPETLVSAIRRVAAGGRYIEPALAEQMVFEAGANSLETPHERLSDREFQILRLLAQGHSVNEIADMLAISNRTVSTHKTRLMQKIGVDNNAKLVRYALTHALLG
ncbi:MAG: response regulator transcription factor [Methylococcaceae bacterium]|nr:MAG: response regulator transcription factor [Methylococcaceae bacterium]